MPLLEYPMTAPQHGEPAILFVCLDFTTPGIAFGAGYHLGVGYLRAYLEGVGVATDQLIDAAPVSLAALARKIVERNVGIIGFTCYDPTYYLIRELSAAIKLLAPDRTIVVGGPSATFSDELILSDAPAVDFCIRGEGEEAAEQLISAVNSGQDISDVSGLSYRHGGEIVRNVENVPRSSRKDEELDSLPSPYLTGMIPPSEGWHIGVVSSRGCRYRCTFCNFASMTHHTVRLHSPERLVAELSLINHHTAKSAQSLSILGEPYSEVPLHIFDDNFTHFTAEVGPLKVTFQPAEVRAGVSERSHAVNFADR